MKGGKTLGDAARRLLRNREFGLSLVLLALVALVGLRNPAFSEWSNLQFILGDTSVMIILALGMMCVLLVGSIDISVSAVMALSAMTAGILMKNSLVLKELPGADGALATLKLSTPLPLLLLLASAVGAACGAVNGLLIAYGRVLPIVATLGSQYTIYGLSHIISGGQAVYRKDMSEAFIQFTRESLLGFNSKVFIMLAVFALLSVFISLLLSTASVLAADKPIRIGVVYKQTGNPFFEAAVRGFQQASEELGFEFIHNGPADSSNEGQIQIIEGFIQQEVDAIAISANDAAGVVSVLQTAMDKGIKVISWDSKVLAEGRQLNIDPSVAQNIGRVQVEEIAQQIGGEGQIAILSAAATHDNQNTWIRYMKEELEKPEYSKIELVTVVYGDDLTDKSYQEMQGLINSYPDLKGVISPTTVGVAAAAVAIKDNGLSGKIKLTGLGLPSEMADHLADRTCEGMYLWNPIDLGYAAAYASVAMVKGGITGAAGEKFSAGRLGEREIMDAGDGGTFTIVGDPFRFTPENIEEWKNVY